MTENNDTGIIRDEQGRFIEGVSGNPQGRKPDTPEQKIVKRAIKELVKEYKEDLAQVLPEIKPVLVELAKKGDMSAIREIHDRVMDKSKQPTDITSDGKVLPTPIINVSTNDSNAKDTEPKQEN